MSSNRGGRGGRGASRGQSHNHTGHHVNSNHDTNPNTPAHASAFVPTGPSSSTSRGRGEHKPRGRGNNAPRGTFAQTPRGNATSMFSGRGRGAPRGGGQNLQQASSSVRGNHTDRLSSSGTLKEREEQLKKRRIKEKADAIANGFMTDPDKQIRVSEAITIVGTCEDKCPENERVLRSVRNEVWTPEKDANGQPDESRMVKAFKRSAAGDDVQLPSDLRPPRVLKDTCDYLFDELIAHNPLAKVHHFVWDRTRAIRNDFSIQQLTRLDDIRIAVDCFERIARFHIVSLHQLASPQRPYAQYTPQQEREQLDRTLLSLMQYYDDTRGRLDLDHEAEFRAYCVLFQLRNPTPDLEDRIQSWPRKIGSDPRVQTALKVYQAVCTINSPAGPLQPRAEVIARQDWEFFWSVVNSRRVSYLAACVAEIWFMTVREMVLSGLVRMSKTGKLHGKVMPITDWTIDELWNLFNFDNEEELRAYFDRWDLQFQEPQDGGPEYLEIAHLAGKSLPNSKQGPDHLKSSLVEDKRQGRALSAIINGLNVRQAKEAGMVEEEEEAAEEEEEEDTGIEAMEDAQEEAEMEDDLDDGESLFVPELKQKDAAPQTVSSHGKAASQAPSTSGFGKPSPFSFGQPSGAFGAPSQSKGSNPFAIQPTWNAAGQGVEEKKNPFSFVVSPAPNANDTQKPFSFGTTTSSDNAATNPFSFAKPDASAAPAKPILGGIFNPAAPDATTQWKPATNNEASSSAIPSKNGTDTNRQAGPFQEESSTASQFKPAQTSQGNSWAFGNGFLSNPQSQAPATAATPVAPAVPTAPAAPGQQMQPDPNAKSPPSQISSPTSSSQHAPTNATASISGPQSPTRRQLNWDNKPKKPSPLANSYTANDENAPLGARQSTPRAGDKPPLSSDNQFRFPTASEPQTTTSPALIAAPASRDNSDAIITKLATELCLNPRRGLLKQYLDFHVQEAIANAQKTVLEEQIQRRLAILRFKTVARKWLAEWRRIVFIVRKKAQMRQKQRERLSRKFNGSATGEISNATSLRKRRGAPKVISPGKQRQIVDEMFYQMAQNQNDLDLDIQAEAGSSRTASTRPAHKPGPKRLTGMAHVDGRGRISKSSDPNADILNRSSFLGFSLAPDADNRATTTKSTYFRMKALGLKGSKPRTDSTSLRGTKRPRSESFDTTASSQPPRSVSQLDSHFDQSQDNTLMRPPPSTRSVRYKTNDDDALFARLKAAREALNDGETFMRDAVAKEEQLRRSMSRSQSSNESPSMERARAEARLRASQSTSDFGASVSGRDVPAYRLRQSRFLTSEEQSRAIERAHEMRASRASQGTSGPESRSNQQAWQPSFDISQPEQIPLNERRSAACSLEASNGPVEPTALPSTLAAASKSATIQSGFGVAPAQPSTPSAAFGHQGFAVQAPQDPSRDPFSQSSSFMPAPSHHNPFLQATASTTSSYGFLSGNTGFMAPSALSGTWGTRSTQDQTVDPLQIDGVLSHTFGPQPTAPSPFGQAMSHSSLTPAPTNSYMPSQAASEQNLLLSDVDGDDSNQGPNDQAKYFGNESGNDFNNTSAINGLIHSPAQSYDQNVDPELLLGAYASANSFAGFDEEAGAHGNASSEDGYQGSPPFDSYQHSDDEAGVEPSDDEDEDGIAETETSEQENTLNGHYYGSEDEGDMDGEDEGDGESYDSEIGYDESDGENEGEQSDEDDGNGDSRPLRKFVPLNDAFNRLVEASQPDKNSALQGVGGTVEEAIELSD